VLTLIFVPVFYAVIEQWRERLSSTKASPHPKIADVAAERI
jgi:hypothetical protein